MTIVNKKALLIFTSHERELEFVEEQRSWSLESRGLELPLLNHQSKGYDEATLNDMHKVYLYWLGEGISSLLWILIWVPSHHGANKSRSAL